MATVRHSMLKSKYGGEFRRTRRSSVAAADANARLPATPSSHQRHRLDHQLPDDARSPGAERHAHAELAHAAGGPRHHQVAEIRRRHDRTRPVRLPSRETTARTAYPLARPHEVVAREQRLQPLIALDLRPFGGHRLHRRAKCLACRGRRYASAQPAVHVDAVAVSVPGPQERALRIEILALRDRNEYVGHVEIETGQRWRGDAGDGHGMAVDVSGRADDVGFRAEPVVPERIAEHDRRHVRRACRARRSTPARAGVRNRSRRTSSPTRTTPLSARRHRDPRPRSRCFPP